MALQNGFTATVIGNQRSCLMDRSRSKSISNWVKGLLLALVLFLGMGLSARDAGDHDGPIPPANWILAPTSGSLLGIGQVITFKMYSVNTSYPPTWYFGDGSSLRTSALSCTHSYSTGGAYTVKLVYPQIGNAREGTPSVTYTIPLTVLARPVITNLTASVPAINKGQSTTLNWAVSGSGLSVSLNQGIGAVSASGSRPVAPSSTTAYTLTAYNISGTLTATCTITVNQPPVWDTMPAIRAFDAATDVNIVLPAGASDPEGCALTYSVMGLPYGLSFNSDTRTLTGNVGVPGRFPIRYIATDPKGASASVNAALIVQAAGIPPGDGVTLGIRYEYDDQGRLARLVYPSGNELTYTYDDLDRVTRVAQNGATVVPMITYDDWGNPMRREFRSGSRDEWAYDASGARVTKWTIGITGEGALPEVREYSYDAADRLTKAGEWDTLGYDVNSRLTKAKSEALGIDNDLGHDAYNNNIKSVSNGALPASMVRFEFNPMTTNHIPGSTKAGGAVLINETNWGEITELGTAVGAAVNTFNMTWDGLGRMTSATHGPADSRSTESYHYAASGLRVTRLDSLNPALNRVYAYTGTGQLLSEYTANPSPAWARDVIYLGTQAIAEVDANGVHELHSDHLGSPRVITSPAGTVEGTQAYGPYGELLQQTGYVPLTGYTGHLQTEPTGLIYMRGRFYSPAWHRFMNSDQGVDPGGLNQFCYVIGTPLMHTDPTGMIDPDSGRGSNFRSNEGRGGNDNHGSGNTTPGLGAGLLRAAKDLLTQNPVTQGFYQASDVFALGMNATLGTNYPTVSNMSNNVLQGGGYSGALAEALKVQNDTMLCALTGKAAEVAFSLAPGSVTGPIGNFGRKSLASQSVPSALEEAIAKGQPTTGHPNQVMTKLDDGNRVLFRKDFGPESHPVNGPFKGMGDVDHYNIQIQNSVGKTINNVHIAPDGKGGYIVW